MSDKFILKSKTIWGLLIASAPQLALLLGYDFTPADASELNTRVESLVTSSGLLLAFFGRIRAKQGLRV